MYTMTAQNWRFWRLSVVWCSNSGVYGAQNGEEVRVGFWVFRSRGYVAAGLGGNLGSDK